MPNQITNGAVMTCSFGAAPSTLVVLPVNRVMAAEQPAATVMDHLPIANIPPFGMCSAPSNPMVASATAAALGVLTPMPCVPLTLAPWMPGVPTAMIAGLPALDDACKLTCSYAGVIQVAPAQITVQF